MKAVAALAAMIVLLLAGPLPGPAHAAGPVAPGPAALTLELTELSPRVVTAGSPATVVVTGTLRNTGPVPVTDLQVRLQRGEPLRTEGAIRDALDGRDAADSVNPQFTDVPGTLAPGDTVPVRVAVPLQGPPETSLAVTRTGVHELLVNVNGVPAGGDRARLAAVRLLLPVIGLPGAPPAGPRAALPLTLLYPIADVPRRLPTVPGEPLLLTDDPAAALAPQGRLGGLVAALGAGAPPGSAARAATCLALDADLVETVALMREGYLVRTAGGGTVDGTGAEAAAGWIAALTAAARDMCVVALPFADADLVALHRAGLADRADAAVADGRAVLGEVLGLPLLDGVTWPAGGVVDDGTLAALGAAGGRAVVLSADAVSGRATAEPVGVRARAAGPTLLAVLTDPLATVAAAGPGPVPGPAAGGVAPVSTAPAGTVSPLATQDLVGTIAHRALTAAADRPVPLVAAPPHVWATDADGARALLDAVGTLVDEGRAVPRSLAATVAVPVDPGGDPRRPLYPLRGPGGTPTSAAVPDAVRDAVAAIDDLASAADDTADVGAGIEETFGPLVRGTVRPASAAWWDRPPGSADEHARLAAERIAQLRAAVRVLEPPTPLALASRDAPLLLTVTNGLPVTVRVRVELTTTNGLRVAPIPEVQVPPLGRRQVTVTTEVTRSGQFTVAARLRTPDGGLLGPPSRLQVRSTTYGTITVWLTGTAGVLLVVLAARRILRRVRGGGPPDDRIPPPERPPPPGPPPAVHDPLGTRPLPTPRR